MPACNVLIYFTKLVTLFTVIKTEIPTKGSISKKKKEKEQKPKKKKCTQVWPRIVLPFIKTISTHQESLSTHTEKQ
jgi:hypothetical protein